MAFFSKRYLPALFWSAGLGWGLLWPFEPGDVSFLWLPRFVRIHGDKVVHAALFFMLGLLLRWALRRNGSANRLLIAFSLAAGYGLLLELLQAKVPQRSFEVLDIAANSFGAFLATLPFERLRGTARDS